MKASGEDYEGRLRIRACGILIEKGKLLLVQLFSPISNKKVWTPPGGGVKFGESVQQTLRREFKEETGLEVKTRDLVMVHELRKGQYQAIEFFFRVERVGGSVTLGADPERNESSQIISKVEFKQLNELEALDLVPEQLKRKPWEKPLSQDQFHFLK